MKLHGSVDWEIVRENGRDVRMVVRNRTPDDLIANPDSEIAIAQPGPSKKAAVGDYFEPLWELAEKRIKNATTVIFVGYRFPETDNEAKRRILESIRLRDWSKPLVLRVVLGPRNHEDVSRVEGMLRWALRDHVSVEHNSSCHATHQQARIVREPMYSQDFLSVVTRDGLHS